MNFCDGSRSCIAHLIRLQYYILFFSISIALSTAVISEININEIYFVLLIAHTFILHPMLKSKRMF